MPKRWRHAGSAVSSIPSAPTCYLHITGCTIVIGTVFWNVQLDGVLPADFEDPTGWSIPGFTVQDVYGDTGGMIQIQTAEVALPGQTVTYDGGGAWAGTICPGSAVSA